MNVGSDGEGMLAYATPTEWILAALVCRSAYEKDPLRSTRQLTVAKNHYACSHCGLHHYARSHAGFNWHSEAHARIPGAHPAPAHLSNDRTHARTHDSTQVIPRVRRTHARWNACIPSRVHQELRHAIVRIAPWLCTRQCHIFIIYTHMYMCAFVRVRCARLGWVPTERYEGTPFGSPMH
jgi:hypothetical protein